MKHILTALLLSMALLFVACSGATTQPSEMATAMNFNLPPPELVIADPSCEKPKPATARNPLRPEYPAQVRKERISGRVVLRVHHLKDGSVQEVQVISTPDERLTSSALKFIRMSRYAPATCNGAPVEALQYEVVTYTLQ